MNALYCVVRVGRKEPETFDKWTMLAQSNTRKEQDELLGHESWQLSGETLGGCDLFKTS